jgi:hypothetical protein
MTRTTVLAAALLAGAAAGSLPRVDPEFSADRIKAHVTFLADDLLEGREAGTRGHDIAARYIASQFAQLNVKPAAPDGTYFQFVDLLEAAQTGPKPTFTVKMPGGTQVMDQGGAVVIRGPLDGGSAAVTAPLVFAGYGMKDAAVGYDDYAGLDVRGKIVVVLRGSPTGMDSEVGAHLQSEQARVAGEHGAAAIVFVPTRLSTRAIPWERRVELSAEPLATWVRKDGTPFDPGYGLRISATIDPRAAGALFDGAAHTLEELLDEADRMGARPRGFALKSTAEIRATTTVRRFSSPEVVGLIEGSDPALKEEYVLLMGHADHIGIKAEAAGDRINNGALDNGAGIAALIEVARAFSNASERPRRSILIVAHTAEEKGLLGAEYFANYPPVPVERMAAAINLDMPILLYSFTDVVAFGGPHTTLEAAIRKAAGAMDVSVSPDPMPGQAIFVRSDHYPLVKKGVPAVMLATGMANGGEAAWARYFASSYHHPSDDLSQPIVWSAAAKFAELNFRVIRELADADTRAQWFAGDYFGDRFAPGAPKVARPATR